MGLDVPPSVFILGRDYHLGDLLWFTAVLAEYRRQRAPDRVVVLCPDRGISRILAENPLIEELRFYDGRSAQRGGLERLSGAVVHDLRIAPLALAMVRRWRERLPWLYYRDLWVEPRGQWLATFLGLGPLPRHRPILRLVPEDRLAAMALPERYIVLAPHIGTYSFAPAAVWWRRMKGWDTENWREVARRVRAIGFEPVTLAAEGQRPIEGTRAVLGLPIRQAAGVIEGADALVSGESGLWFIAAALGVPFIITPWWLPRSIDWAAPMDVPYRLLPRSQATPDSVLDALSHLVQREIA
jgi:ADP-heptose:LPS heptosyltransferase